MDIGYDSIVFNLWRSYHLYESIILVHNYITVCIMMVRLLSIYHLYNNITLILLI